MGDKQGGLTNFIELKRALSGTSADEPANCGIVVFNDNTAAIAASRKTSGKRLAQALVKDGEGAGLQRRARYFGTAFADEYPGTLNLSLNKAASGLDAKLRAALRGSGYGRFEISESEAEEEDYETDIGAEG